MVIHTQSEPITIKKTNTPPDGYARRTSSLTGLKETGSSALGTSSILDPGVGIYQHLKTNAQQIIDDVTRKFNKITIKKPHV